MTARLAAAVGVLVALAGALAQPAAARAAPPCPASVAAPSAVVVEVSTGIEACARRAGQRRPVASTTKLMTALLVLERAKLSATFTAAHYHPAPVESAIGLEPGERMRVADLMRGLLVQSANDAAETLAVGVAGSQRAFVRLMNRRARQLGLTDTHYANPIGLDEAGNYSSARDLVRLATVLRTNAFFKATVDSPSVTLRSGAHPRTYANRNTLVRRYPWVNGVKTGHTLQAGYVLVGSGRRHGVQVVSAVLDAPSEAARDADSLALLRFGLSRFRRIAVVVRGHAFAVVPIRYRNGARLRLLAARTVRRIVLRAHRGAVSLRVRAPHEIQGPIRKGSRLGSVQVREDGRVVATVPLVAAGDVPAAGLAQKTKAWAARPLVLVLAALAAAACSVVVARRRRAARSGSEAPREASAA